MSQQQQCVIIFACPQAQCEIKCRLEKNPNDILCIRRCFCFRLIIGRRGDTHIHTRSISKEINYAGQEYMNMCPLNYRSSGFDI